MSIDLIYYLNEHGYRIFSIDDIYSVSDSLGMTKNYIPKLLSNLAHKGSIHHIIKSKYSLDNNLLAGPPLHEFEIATSLSKDSAIAYISAMSFHNLTDQMANMVYAISFSLENSINQYSKKYIISGNEYVVVRTSRKNKWGIKAYFIDEIQFYVTDVERTLLDAIERPQYCMGIREILYAFETAKNQNKIDVDKICTYSLEYGNIALIKRLGFILAKIGITSNAIDKLREIPSKSYQKLDILGERKGKYDKEWMIIENI